MVPRCINHIRVRHKAQWGIRTTKYHRPTLGSEQVLPEGQQPNPIYYILTPGPVGGRRGHPPEERPEVWSPTVSLHGLNTSNDSQKKKKTEQQCHEICGPFHAALLAPQIQITFRKEGWIFFILITNFLCIALLFLFCTFLRLVDGKGRTLGSLRGPRIA